MNRIYSIKLDSSIEEYASISSCNNESSKYIITEEDGFENEINIKFNFFNKSEEKIQPINRLMVGRVKLKEISQSSIQSISTFKIAFVDQFDKVIRPTVQFGTGIYGILNIIKYLEEINSFDSYQNYSLHKQNIKLLERIELLEAEMKALNNSASSQ